MKYIFISISALLFFLSLHGQCPDKSWLWNRIIFLRDSSTVSPENQLAELLAYQNNIAKCSYRNDSVHAFLLQRIGWLYTTKNDFFGAVQFTQKSIALIDQQKNNPAMNAAMAIKSYWNLYIMYDSLKLESKKIMACDSCISYAIRLNANYEYALEAIRFILPMLFSAGDYYKCISYSELGENIISKNRNALNNQEGNLFEYFVWKINSLILLNKADDGIKSLEAKIHIAESYKNINTLGTLYGLYATILRDKKKFNDAIICFKKSFAYHKKISNNEGCVEALNNIGFIYSSCLYQNKTARFYYNKALAYSDDNEALNILDNIANIYAQAGNYDSAFYFFKKSYDRLHEGFTEVDLLKDDDTFLNGKMTEYVTNMLLDKASAFLNEYEISGNQKYLNESLHIYETTDRFFDKLKISQADIQSKLFWKKNNKRLYEQAIEACYASKNIEKAFYFFEKNRSVLLNNQIALERKMNETDLMKQAQLKLNIIQLRKDLQNADTSSNNYFKIQKELFMSVTAAEELIKKINDQNSNSYQNNSDTSFITITQLRKNILNDSKILLEIFSGDSAAYVLTITRKNQSLTKINKQLYDSLTNSFISSIGNRYILNKHFKDFINTSHHLYKLLFQSILPGNYIIISPDGKGFPFEALVMNESVEQPDYLLKHYAISYTYSAKYLTNQFAYNTSGHNSILGIAPVQYNSQQNLAELSGSDKSLKIINSYFKNTKTYTYEHATLNNFLQNFPTCSIIQLYTHASETSNNNDPVIYFSDSALYLSSLIPDRKPVTQLVVLSACETANGKLYEGEGVFSFNRAFASLGVPAAISNLWSVDNLSTYTITELFYKYLSKGLPTDVALQKAKLEFIDNSSSEEKKLPYFWAASILTGKVDVIKAETAFPWLKASGIASIILIFMYLLYKFFKHPDLKK